VSIAQTQLLAYQARWVAVEEVEAREQREATIAERWQKLNSLLRMASGLDIVMPRDEEQIAVVRQRWNFLKDHYLNEQKKMAASNPLETLEPLLGPINALQRLIENNNNRGVIIGSIAASILGKPRLTADADALLLLPIDDIPQLLELAKQEGLLPRHL
jgi:hypothetical protein